MSTPAAPRWRLRLLGSAALIGPDGAERALVQRAETLLLARLALSRGQRQPREELAELLWPGAGAAVARNRLRQALAGLRERLDGQPLLQADRQTIGLVPGLLDTDVDALLAALARGEPAARAFAERPEAAAALLPGHHDDWVEAERAWLASRLEAAPRAPAPPPAPAPAAPTLPRYVTRWFDPGRSVVRLARRVAGERLVVLRGPGGAGKTRMAIEVAGALQGRFDRIVFVPLASCTTRAQALDTLLHALRQEPGRGDAADRVPEALQGGSTLLVLDNLEQLVDTLAPDLQRWLAQLPALHLLATSRRSIGLDGEVEELLEALPLPGAGGGAPEPPEALQDNPAVALFVDRARAVQPAFRLDDGNAAAVVGLVHALGGLPLALELAAARLRSLGLAELHTLLAGERRPSALALLSREGPRAGADTRHASMTAVLRWSWQQLDADAQELLQRLASCGGGASLALLTAFDEPGDGAALAVRVDALVAASVVYARDEPDAGTRWFVYEPMRDYVQAQQPPGEPRRRQHEQAAAVARWAARLDLRSPAVLHRVRAEWLNLLQALQPAAGGPPDPIADRRALDTALALRSVLHDRGLPAGVLAALREAAAREPRHRAEAVQALLALQSYRAGQSEAARGHAQAVPVLPPAAPLGAEQADDLAFALCGAARVLLRLGERGAGVLDRLQQAEALALAHGLHGTQALVLGARAVWVRQTQGDSAAAGRLHAQALALWREHGPPARVAEGLVNLALVPGPGAAARLALLTEAEALSRRHGQDALHAFVLSVRGYTLAELRRWPEAAAAYRTCLQQAWAQGHWREWFYALWNLPRTLARQHRPEAAARLMGFAEGFYASRFGVLGPEDLRERRSTRRLVAAQIGAAALAAAWAAGAATGQADAMALALAETTPPADRGAPGDGGGPRG